MNRVLVLCTGNACRSQMAEGWLRHVAPEAYVRSAGTAPHGVHPLAVRVMAEAGVDLSDHTSDHVDRYRAETFDHVVTVCDRAAEACPIWPGMGERHHHGFPDPAAATGTEDEVLAVFREVRDQIRVWAEGFAAEQLYPRLH